MAIINIISTNKINFNAIYSQINEIIQGDSVTEPLPEIIREIRADCFQASDNLVITKLPDSLTTIGSMAFMYCHNLTLTSLPSGLTSIGTYAFRDCTALALTSLPLGITTIVGYTFDGCPNTAFTSLPAVNYIATHAFDNNTSLTSLTIGSSGNPVTVIATTAFAYCSNLTSLTIYKTNPGTPLGGSPWGATSATVTYAQA